MRRLPQTLLLILAFAPVWTARPAADPPATVPSSSELPALTPPRPVFGVSPVDFFRALLKMSPAEREAALAGRPPQQARSLLAKAAEYEAMPAAERNIKLRLVSLRYYLAPLMRIPATNRAPFIAAVPLEDRPLVEERLRLWDQVSPPLQREFLANEATIQYFLRLEFAAPAEKDTEIRNPPPGDRAQVDLAVARWKSFPPARRRQMSENFHRFFELSEPDRVKTLESLSELERRQMEAALQKFAGLPPEERDRCIDSFRKFANMSPAERDEFLRNAERWRLMTPAERQTWRELVEKLPAVPPLPPGLQPVRFPPMPGPPMPQPPP